MEIVTPGHKYILEYFEDKTKEGQEIQFIEKLPKPTLDGSITTELSTINDGTTNEEVLEMLIDRMIYLNTKFPCRENSVAITNLEQALMWLNKRTQDRLKRGVEGKQIK